ncbi:hypothetical protein B0H12DRAFT_202057 [Mycena haematopus]|nr:hypothetical protein B0H12DRAFT_202057 [Mycena haematopus]
MPPASPSTLRQRLLPRRRRPNTNDPRSSLNTISSPKYPVLTLPPEITAEIFKWSLGAPVRLHSSAAPLLLTRICRDWRTLALSTPALWDTISQIEWSVNGRTEAVIEGWFKRAGTRPLSLRIVSPDMACLESVLLHHASQLQSLEVTSVPADFFCDLTAVQLFPILRNLMLSCVYGYDYGTDIQLFGGDGAPSLRHLSLEMVRPSVVIMPRAQLTKMTLSLVTLSECLKALRWATSLHEFCRKDALQDEERSRSGWEESPVHHSAINSLAISTSEEDQDILPFLTLPRLERLELGCPIMDYRPHLNVHVVPFLARVSSTLRTFHIDLSRNVPVHWLQPLTQITTLELVRRGDVPFKPAVIRALDRRTSPDLLPTLQSLVFLDCGTDQVDDELLGAIRSRCDVTDAAHAKLESFSLIWPTGKDHYGLVARLPLVNVLPLRALAERGMRIHIGTRDQNSFY